MGSMFRRVTALSVLLLVALPVAAAPAGADAGAVSGTMTGPGGFRPEGCGLVSVVGSGTYSASVLGRGTYTYDVCVLAAAPYAVSGTIAFVRSNGARLDATIDGLDLTQSAPTYHATVAGGTKRYRNATGELRIGGLAQTDRHNCDPRIGICVDWTDTGPLSGRVRSVRSDR